jgi:hypothetical protein
MRPFAVPQGSIDRPAPTQFETIDPANLFTAIQRNYETI